MVAEIRMGDGAWEAFSERIPDKFDDAIEANFAEFYKAAARPAAEDLFNVAPVSLPTTRNVQGCDLVAECPVDDWMETREPCSSARSWCRLAMKIAEIDAVSLYEVLEIAEKEIAKFPKDKVVTDGTEVFKSHSALSSGPSIAAADATAS